VRHTYLTLVSRFPRLVMALVVAALSVFAPAAYAQLLINEPVIDMRSDERLRAVEFRNTGDTAVRVSLDLEHVVSPATSNPYNEYTVPADQNGVIVTPQVLVIPSQGTAQATVQRSLKDLDTDEVYRLKVKPIREPSSSPIVLNYDLLLLVRPQKASASISLKRTASGIALINRGNSNALMSSMQLCDLSIDDCQALSTQRLYANERWTVPVPEHFDVDHLVLRAEQIHQSSSQRIEYRAKQPSSL